MILRMAILAVSLLFCNYGFCEELTPEGVLSAFENEYAGINDYQCRVDEWCSNGRAYEKRVIYYYFKKPRMIRSNILEGNKAMDAGSSAVYTGGKKVTGHNGGILSGIVLELDKKDPLVTTVRGRAMDEGDLQAIIENLRFHLKDSKGSVSILSNGDIELVGYYEDASKNGGLSREVLVIDPKTYLPKLADGYEGDKLVEHTVWSGFILNAGLPDELFSLKYEAKNLKKMGIQTLP